MAACARGAAEPTAGRGPSIDAGAAGTVGSAGYGKVLLYGDGYWRARLADPYLWTEWSRDNFLSQFSLGGGAWKDLRPDLRVKGGLGAVFGRLADSGDSSDAVVLETGLEKDFARPTVGAECRLTAGSIVGPTELRAATEATGRRARALAAADVSAGAGTPESFTYTELSSYATLPAGRLTPGLRLTFGFPSYSSAVVDETFSLRARVSKPLYANSSFTLEQGPFAGVYVSLGLMYIFR